MADCESCTWPIPSNSRPATGADELGLSRGDLFRRTPCQVGRGRRVDVVLVAVWRGFVFFGAFFSSFF